MYYCNANLLVSSIFFHAFKEGYYYAYEQQEREKKSKLAKRQNRFPIACTTGTRRTRPGHSAFITRNPRWKDIIKDQRASSRSAINYSCNDIQQAWDHFSHHRRARILYEQCGINGKGTVMIKLRYN